MRVFKTGWFSKYARKEKISNKMLCNAIQEAEDGLIDANLGSGVIKQRIARQGEGKSGGYRTLLYYRIGHRAVFAFGFAKNAMDNISAKDLRDLKDAASMTLGYTEAAMTQLVELDALEEVTCK